MIRDSLNYADVSFTNYTW